MNECPHTSMHGIEVEHRQKVNLRRSNPIGPDVWECDACLTLQVEDSVGLLDSQGRDIRARLAELRTALAPFAGLDISPWEDAKDSVIVWGINNSVITVGDIRRAVAALEAWR